MKPLEEAGFVCPRLNFALRNPVKIADYAQKVVQDGGKNFLEAVLRSPIEISKEVTNMPEGQLVDTKIVHETSLDALQASAEKIPVGRYALFFIDKTISQYEIENIIKETCNRPLPMIFTGKEGTTTLKDWLCEPQRRKNDMCIIGTQHQCNGIEIDIVIHVHVANCPMCGISNADPVIISRAKAMLIISTYKRPNCICGWNSNLSLRKQSEHESAVGWITPYNSDDEESTAHCYGWSNIDRKSLQESQLDDPMSDLDSAFGAHEQEILEETNDDQPFIPNTVDTEDLIQRDENYQIKKLVKGILLVTAFIILCVGITLIALHFQSEGKELRI